MAGVKCSNCSYPYVPFHGKRKGRFYYGDCPNCGYNMTRNEDFFEAVGETINNVLRFGCLVFVLFFLFGIVYNAIFN